MEPITSSSTETKRCGICTGFLSGQPFLTSECAHSFHVGCYQHYLNKNKIQTNCPVCKTSWTTTINIAPSPLVEPEPLPLPAADSSIESLQKVTIKAVPERPAIASSESVSPFTVLVGVKAPSLPESALSSQRAPVDLVAVLDVSRSMSSSSKLNLLKQAVHFVIDNLGPNDRLSIVSFSDSAKRKMGLTFMTENGRVDAKKAVSLLRATGCTNIVAGLKKGVRVLEKRLHKNPVTSIIFLSDGNDNENGPRYLNLLPAAIYPKGREQKDADSALPQTIPVHSFGFGSDHDPVAMHAISDASGGTFSFIESYEMVQDAFASCIGGLLSVVSQELRLTVRSASHGVEITSLSTGRYVGNISDQGSQGVINVGDIYADEEKEFLIDLTVPRLAFGEIGVTSLLDIGCCYKDIVSKEVVNLESKRVEIRRPKEVSPEDTVVNLEVDRQRNRVKAAESLAKAQEMAEEGDLAGGRRCLSSARKNIMYSNAARAGDRMSKWLGNDMKETEVRFESKKKYLMAGRAFALSGKSSHGMQRAAMRRKADGPEFSSWGLGYATGNMLDMVRKSQQQVNNNSSKKRKTGQD